MVAGDRRALWLMASPFLVGVLALILLPAIGSLAMSFFEWDLVRSPRFVGSANVRELVGDPVFRIASGTRCSTPPPRCRSASRARWRSRWCCMDPDACGRQGAWPC